MVNGNRKGKVGERELSAKLRELGFPDSRRGQQFSGANGDADIVGIPGVFVECKRVQRLDITKAMKQAISDAKGDIPAVFLRKNNEEWTVTMRLTDWAKLWHERNVPLVDKKDG